jgi:nucleotide-binding universal stress UspA family protein
MLQKILLAIGDSPESEKILASGLNLAEKFGSELLILHVLNPLTPHGFETMSNPLVGGVLPIVDDQAIEKFLQEWQEYEKRGLAKLQSYAQQASDRQIKAEILQNFGDSGPIICDTAKTWSADLILMGRNQKSTLSEIFLGSTSSYVLHRAPCSVMVLQLPALAS